MFSNHPSTLCTQLLKHPLPEMTPFFPEGNFTSRNWCGKTDQTNDSALWYDCVCVTLTMSAVWFLLRTALCRAVMPSFVLKSRCAPPLFSTLMSSAQPSSCAASVKGHSVRSKDNEANKIKSQCISNHMILNSS